MRLSILILIVLLCAPHLGFAWGELGHKAISEAVQANLEPATARAVARIVGTDDELPAGTLAQLSVWPDQIRPFTRKGRSIYSGFSPEDFREAMAFARAHPDNPEWHYVDLPLGSEHYPDTSQSDPSDPVLPFTSPHDIVHIIQQCIEILEAETESPEFTKRQALRWLLHLVEDLHQPLHVASGYYSTAPDSLGHPQRIDDPATVTEQQAKNDRGGNVLLFLKRPHCPTTRTQQNLHSVWDDCLVDVVNGSTGCKSPTTEQDVSHLAEILKAEMRLPAAGSYRTGGDIHHWAEQWATDALKVARTHVFTIQVAEGCVITSDQAPHDPLHVQSRIVTPASKKRYLQNHHHAAKVQLTKAAVRLADLLNHMSWK